MADQITVDSLTHSHKHTHACTHARTHAGMNVARELRLTWTTGVAHCVNATLTALVQHGASVDNVPCLRVLVDRWAAVIEHAPPNAGRAIWANLQRLQGRFRDGYPAGDGVAAGELLQSTNSAGDQRGGADRRARGADERRAIAAVVALAA